MVEKRTKDMLVGIILGICTAVIGVIAFVLRAGKKAEQHRYYDAAYRMIKEDCLNDAICNKGQKSRREEKLMVYLKWKDYERQGYVFDPGKGVRIGRDPDKNDICIREATVSSRHCMLFLHQGSVYLKDIHSSNGTLLKRGLTSVPVQGTVGILSGDKIIVGGLAIRVTLFKFDMTYM